MEKTNKIVEEYQVKCQLCEKMCRGRSPKEADNNYQKHYFFQHSKEMKDD